MDNGKVIGRSCLGAMVQGSSHDRILFSIVTAAARDEEHLSPWTANPTGPTPGRLGQCNACSSSERKVTPDNPNDHFFTALWDATHGRTFLALNRCSSPSEPSSWPGTRLASLEISGKEKNAREGGSARAGGVSVLEGDG